MKREMTAMEALLTRRSVRSFTDEPVSEVDVRAVVRAGMYAPSAGNRRAWRVLTITDRRMLDALMPMSKWWNMLRDAPLCLVCLQDSTARTPQDAEFLVQDGAALTQNMLLALHALGLGDVWLGIHPGRPYYEQVRELLHIPEELRVVSLIAAGHVKEPLPARAAPQERFEEEKWIRECF